MADNEGNVAMVDLNAPDGAADSTDPGGWGARLVGALDLQLGRLTSSTDATTNEIRKLRREARQQPALTKISSVFTWNSAAGAQMCQQGGTGAGVLIGGPQIGEQWNITQIIVAGTTLAATPAGTAWFLVSASPPNEQSITSVIDFTHQALPQVAYYSPQQFYLAPNENLWVVITGGTNNLQYVCSVTLQSSSFVPRQTQTDI